MNAVINSDEILSNVKQMLRIFDSSNDTYISSIILRGARDLSTNETLIIKNCEVSSKNSRFYLPDDCKRILAFRSSDSCIPGTFVDLNFFTQCGCSATSSVNSLSNLLDVQGRWAYFILSVADDTEFELAYQALDTGSDGMIRINEEAYSALSFYAAFQFATSYPELYTPEQRALWKGQASAQGARVRGLAARRKFMQAREQIKNKINQMVNTSVPLSILSGTYNTFLYPTITSI